MTHILLPFMVLPLYAVMRGIDNSFMRAAISMGSRPLSYCQIWCLRLVGHAAILLGLMASIPFLNVTPVMTFAK
jgi:ABC-type spermidine/putrescine transport system permease subunit II